MDPDGLTLLASVVLGAAACALCWRAGALCAHGEERAAGARLGFSDKSIGVFVLAGLCVSGAAVAAFFWCAQVLRVWWGLMGLALLAVLGVLFFALGAARGKEGCRSGLASLAGAAFGAPAKLVFRLCGIQPGAPVTQEDLLNMVDESEEHDVIDEGQKEMINNIFELADVTAGDIMTHRTELVAVPDTATAHDVVELSLAEGVSRIPVYRKTLDDIEGIVYVKDLFTLWNKPGEGTRPAREFVRSAMFVPESCRAHELLIELRAKHAQIAVVVDEYGGTSGVVTMEDVLEEIVGNIQDEFDNEEEELLRTEDGLVAAGSADIDDVFDALGLALPPESEDDERDFDTVGGLVTDRLGRIPAPGEAVRVEWGGAAFTVLEAGERRVNKVLCQTLAGPGPEKEN